MISLIKNTEAEVDNWYKQFFEEYNPNQNISGIEKNKNMKQFSQVETWLRKQKHIEKINTRYS